MAVVDFIFRFSQGQASWTEKLTFAGLSEDPDANLDKAKAIAAKRIKLLPSETGKQNEAEFSPRLVSVSIRNTERKRQAATFPLDLPGDKNNPNDKGAGQRAMKVVMYTAGKTHRRILFMRGLPKAWANFDLSDLVTGAFPTATLQNAFEGFFGKPEGPLPPHLSGLVIHTPSWKNPVGGNLITAIGTDNENRWVLGVPDHELIEGDFIKVRGLRGPSTFGVNGVAQIWDTEPDEIVILKFRCRECGNFLTHLGTIQVPDDAKATLPVANAWFFGWSDKKVGNSWDVMQGKGKPCC